MTLEAQWADLRVGDIVQWGNSLRVVRSVKTRTLRYGPNRGQTLPYYIGFAILRCSWTDRPYTIYTYADRLANFRGIVGRDYPLCSTNPAECTVQHFLENDSGIYPGSYPITAQAIRGLGIP